MSYINYIYDIYFKNPSFSVKIIIKRKSPSVKTKGLEIVRLPLLDAFRTFSWGEIIEELRNIYKLKELIRVPSVIHYCLTGQRDISVPHSFSFH